MKHIDCFKQGVISLRNFVLYVCGFLLAPTQDSYVDQKLLLALQYVGVSRHMTGVHLFFISLLHLARILKKTCFALLVGGLLSCFYCYLHLFNFQGRDAPFSLPLCSYWNELMLGLGLLLKRKWCVDYPL